MTVDPLYVVILAVAGLVLVAAIAVRLSARVGVPSLLVYLLLGLVVGEAGLGVPFEDADLARNVGLVALAVILAEGGLTTRWATIRPVLGPSLALATVGVGISVLVVAGAAHWLLGFDTRTSLLLGAVISSTDAAAVFSVLRSLRLQRRLVATLEAESGFNDAPVVILVTLIASDAWNEANPWLMAGGMLYQFAVGALVGVLLGWLGVRLLSGVALPATGLYPISAIALALLSFAAAGAVGASGIVAVYLTGVWLGNSRLPHRRATLGFAEGMAWLAQIGLFVMLGLLASPSQLPDAVLPALAIGLVLVLLARPLSVLVSVTPFRWPWREQTFMAWVGLRGAVPIVLATIAISENIARADELFHIVFVLVVVYTLLQAPTLPWVARRLRVEDAESGRELWLDSAPLAEVRADMLHFDVPPTSRLIGVTIDELRLPRGAAVSIVVREGVAFVPTGDVRLRESDRLLVVSTARARRATERRLRAVSRAGRLAGWQGETGDE